MQVNVTARHFKLTSEIANYVNQKIGKLDKYHPLLDGQVVITKQGYRFLVELIIQVPFGVFRAKTESADLWSAIDLAVDKIIHQTSKHKDKFKDRRKHAASPRVLENQIGIKKSLARLLPKENLVVEMRTLDVKPLTIPQAIEQVQVMGTKFQIFINSVTNQLNIVYLRDDGNYGLAEINYK